MLITINRFDICGIFSFCKQPNDFEPNVMSEHGRPIVKISSIVINRSVKITRKKYYK